MYAIVRTGGKQYRVEQGQSLLVERLRSAEGETVALEPLLCVDGAKLVDGEDLSKVAVAARVVGHERGPKLRIVKFKPKRGYKRRTGHRQELTRLEVTSIKVGAARSRAKAAEGSAESSKAGSKAAGAAEAAPTGEAAQGKEGGKPAPVSASARSRSKSAKEGQGGA